MPPFEAPEPRDAAGQRGDPERRRFLLVFLGAPAATALTTAPALATGEGGALLPVTAALVPYPAMVVVTRVSNIRLSDEPAAAAPAGRDRPAAARRRFDGPWTRWTVVRTLLSTVSTACLVWALTLL